MRKSSTIRSKKRRNRYQVFLSHATSDKWLATIELQASGIEVTTMDQLGQKQEYSSAFRQVVEHSDAIVLALSHVSARHAIPASVLFEAGASMGAGKPIYAVVDNLEGKLPFNAPNLQVLPLSRLGEIALRLEDESNHS